MIFARCGMGRAGFLAEHRLFMVAISPRSSVGVVTDDD